MPAQEAFFGQFLLVAGRPVQQCGDQPVLVPFRVAGPFNDGSAALDDEFDEVSGGLVKGHSSTVPGAVAGNGARVSANRQSLLSLKSRWAANERRWVGSAASNALMVSSVSVAICSTSDLESWVWGA